MRYGAWKSHLLIAARENGFIVYREILNVALALPLSQKLYYMYMYVYVLLQAQAVFRVYAHRNKMLATLQIHMY